MTKHVLVRLRLTGAEGCQLAAEICVVATGVSFNLPFRVGLGPLVGALLLRDAVLFGLLLQPLPSSRDREGPLFCQSLGILFVLLIGVTTDVLCLVAARQSFLVARVLELNLEQCG